MELVLQPKLQMISGIQWSSVDVQGVKGVQSTKVCAEHSLLNVHVSLTLGLLPRAKL